MARFESDYRTLVSRSTFQALTPIQSSLEIVNASMRFNASENEMRNEASVAPSIIGWIKI